MGQEAVMVSVSQVAGQAPFMYVDHWSGHGQAPKWWFNPTWLNFGTLLIVLYHICFSTHFLQIGAICNILSSLLHTWGPVTTVLQLHLNFKKVSQNQLWLVFCSCLFLPKLVTESPNWANCDYYLFCYYFSPISAMMKLPFACGLKLEKECGQNVLLL